jgi:hypothetical protein
MNCWLCTIIRIHITLHAQKLEMCFAEKSDAAAMCEKVTAMSKLIQIYPYLLFMDFACDKVIK